MSDYLKDLLWCYYHGNYHPEEGTKCPKCTNDIEPDVFCSGCPDCKGIVWNGVGD